MTDGSSFTGLVLAMQATAREAARRRGAPARGDVLLVLLARLAQVRVQVDEARRDPAARGVDALGAGRREVAADRDDAPVLDQHVGSASRSAAGSSTRPPRIQIRLTGPLSSRASPRRPAKR